MSDACPPERTIRVLLVDDHTILRQGLKQLMASYADVDVFAEAGDGQQAVVQALSTKPDVILMDINLPQLSGYEASRSILTAWPQAKIVVLTNQDDAHIIKRFLDMGVAGYLLKDVEAGHLVDTIRRVHRSEAVKIAPALEEKVQGLKGSGKSDAGAGLTEREQEVLKALAKGYSNKQLAELLVVSPKTVHNHLYNIYSKIGAGSRAEAIVWALESGFVER